MSLRVGTGTPQIGRRRSANGQSGGRTRTGRVAEGVQHARRIVAEADHTRRPLTAGAAGRAATAPAVDGAQMRRHVVLAVELLRTDAARITLAVEMSRDVMPVEVGGVGVRVVAHLAPVRRALLDAEAADADGR